MDERPLLDQIFEEKHICAEEPITAFPYLDQNGRIWWQVKAFDIRVERENLEDALTVLAVALCK